jgi:hypothetical protein
VIEHHTFASTGVVEESLLDAISAGFGVINLAVAGAQTAPTYTQNAAVGQLFELPRTGTLIARISF